MGRFMKSDSVYATIVQRRSIRRFHQQPVDIDLLRHCVDAARVAPSAANLQPLEYILVSKPALCDQLCPTIGWAGYIQPRWHPAPTERPTAYIVILVRKELNTYYKWDVGLAAAHIMLVAQDHDIGSCLLLNIDRNKIRSLLSIPDTYDIDAVIALGYINETCIVEEFKGNVEYYRDADEVLHVPKRRLADIVHENGFS